ncbi:semaphorin-7A isoform X2 [Kryptolebias marmoratus]|uniref:semaphorin-7A isoform X2 n=1 Tax=Kryptolebias marmoratus TaxID=37003 RepID=UPI0007F91F85|nr:semaphorin-7A isoform X2 [Kryptolebias marmoratus]
MFPSPWVYLFCAFSLAEANSHSPRMVFTYKESQVEKLPLPGQYTPVQILLQGQPGVVAAVGEKHVIFHNFKTPTKVSTKKVVWKGCTDDYSIIVVHQREVAGPVFVCGTNNGNIRCCYMNISEQSNECFTSERLDKIQTPINNIKGGEHSLLVESGQSEDLYITYSGVKDSVGIHKFGSGRVRPTIHDKEQHYVGLVLSRRNDSSQNKIYAFYKQKNEGAGLDEDMWLPYVSQVCMSDTGGPKNNLQFSWTSQMNTRLFCGNRDTKQHFSELVDVATVHSDQWEDTKVYALFRNEWGMSAVCVYTIGDINDIFIKSKFKSSKTYDDIDKQRKTCVRDSTKISTEILMRIKENSEMEQWVLPHNKLEPVLIKHHNYTRIYVDASTQTARGHQTVMFLSLNNGRIHKVVENGNHSFVIAEHQPFNHDAHILSVILHPSSRKLYLNSRSEVVQLDVTNCGQYGNTCEECVLSKDPYCKWSGTNCVAVADKHQDKNREHSGICPSQEPVKLPLNNKENTKNNVVMVSPQSSYFLSCPVKSRHAQYTWHHPGGSSACSMKDDRQCVLLIDSMGPGQVGKYECMSEEMGYRRVLEQHDLQLMSTAAGRTGHPTVWVCLLAVLVRSFWW